MEDDDADDDENYYHYYYEATTSPSENVFLLNHLPRVEEGYFCKTLSCSEFDADSESIIKALERAHRRYVKRCANSY